MKNLSPEKKTLLINGIFSLAVLCVFLPISITMPNLWGLTLGWVIGSLVTFINMLLLFRTGYAISEAAKANKGVGVSVAFGGLRFLLIGAAMVTCALLQYATKVEFFNWSVFTCAASVLPSSLIIALFYKDRSTETNK